MTVILQDQHDHCDRFFDACMSIFTGRGKEYAPEDIPLWDVFLNAVKEHVTVLTVLRILMDKHITAIRHLDIAGRTLTASGGSTAEGRFRDIANFAALQSFYVTHTTELHETWRNHLVQSYRCECVYATAEMCLKCSALKWLDTPWFPAHRPSSKAFPQPPER